MSYFLDRVSGIRCVNCKTAFQVWHARDVLSKCTVFSGERKFFWEPNQFYDPPKEQQIKCKDCQMEQSPRMRSAIFTELAFGLGGIVLTAFILFALLSLIGPEPLPNISLTQEAEMVAQGTYTKQEDSGLILLIIVLLPVPPICFWIARRLSYRLIRFDPLPSKRRASHVGLD